MTDAILDRLMRLHPKLIDLELGRIERLLADVGSPHLKLPPVVHVAGTNGKGSLVAYLRAMAEAAGYRVHVYTSPHLVRFNERIRVAGELIERRHARGRADRGRAGQSASSPSPSSRSRRWRRSWPSPACPPTSPCSRSGWAGACDTTNVVNPALSAITPIGYDHTSFLGDTLEKIAAEKAGILKRTVPAVIGRQREASASVIAARAAELAVPLFRMGREWQVKPTPGGFRYDSDLLGLDLPAPALVGAHQIDNAATAVACIERLRAAQFRDRRCGGRGKAWRRSTGRPACRSSRAGRWSTPCRRAASCGSTAATTRIAASCWRARPPNGPRSRPPLPLYLVFGMLTTKDASGFLRPLARYARTARAVPIEGHAAYTPQEACARAAEVGLDCLPANDIGAALEDLLATQPAPMRILICGSLYLAGDVLARNG